MRFCLILAELGAYQPVSTMGELTPRKIFLDVSNYDVYMIKIIFFYVCTADKEYK